MGRRRARFCSLATAGVAAILLTPAVASAAPPACSPATGLVANVQAGESIVLPAPPCTDPEDDPISIEVTQAPTLGTLDPAGTQPIATQRTYTADADAGGATDTIKFRAVAGGENSNEATLEIHIGDNHAPVCPANLARSVASGGQLVIDQNPCTDADGDPLTYVIVGPPAHGTITGPASNGTYTYKPAAGYVGADSLTYRARDASTESNLGTFSITVTQGNRAPTCADSIDVSVGRRAARDRPGARRARDPDGDALTLRSSSARRARHARRHRAVYTPAGGVLGGRHDPVPRASDEPAAVRPSRPSRITVTPARTGGGGTTVTPPAAVVPPPPDVDGAGAPARARRRRRRRSGARSGAACAVTLTAGEPGRAVIRLLLSRRDARRLGINRKAKRAVAVGKLSRTLAAGETRVKRQADAQGAEAGSPASSTVKLTLEATVTDAAGNVRRVTRAIRLRA